MNPNLRRRPGALSAPLQDLILICALISAVLIAGFSLAGCDTPEQTGTIAPDAATALAAQSASESENADADEEQARVQTPAPAVDEEKLWAGLPLKDMSRLGLKDLALNDYENEWRAGIESGGLVRVYTYATVTEAKEAFRFHAVASSSIWSDRPTTQALPGDEATGDGEGLLVLRDRNLVIYVQSPGGKAHDTAGRILNALVETHPSDVYQERKVGDDIIRWDSVGRRTVVTTP